MVWGQSSKLHSGPTIISYSHPVHFMSISPTLPEIWLFYNLTLMLYVYGHGWGQRSRSHSGPNNLSTHTPSTRVITESLFRNMAGRYGYFTIWPWCYTFMVMGEVKGQGHIVGPTTYQLTPLPPESLQSHYSETWPGWQMSHNERNGHDSSNG